MTKQVRTRYPYSEAKRRRCKDSCCLMLLSGQHRHPGFQLWHAFTQEHHIGNLAHLYHTLFYDLFLLNLAQEQFEIEMEARISQLLDMPEFVGLMPIDVNQDDLAGVNVKVYENTLIFKYDSKCIQVRSVQGGFYQVNGSYIDADELTLSVCYLLGKVDHIPDFLKCRIRI